MSRYNLKPKEEVKHFVSEVAVGFDRPLGGYFIQVFGHRDDDGEDTWVEPPEAVSKREDVLEKIRKYCDTTDTLTGKVHFLIMLDIDPAMVMKKNSASYQTYMEGK